MPRRKSTAVNIRVTPEQRDALKEGAETDDKTVSGWMLDLGLDRLKDLGIKVKKPELKTPSRKMQETK